MKYAYSKLCAMKKKSLVVVTKQDEFSGSAFAQIHISAQRFVVLQVLSGFNVLLQVNPRRYIRSGCDQFLPHHFQVIHLSSYHLMLCILNS